MIFSGNIIKAVAAATFAVAAVASFCSCKEKKNPVDGKPISHCESFDIWPDSVDFHSGIILRASGDSMMEVRVEGSTIRQIKAGAPSVEMFRFSSGLKVLDALYALEAATPLPRRYTSFTPYEAYLVPLQADSLWLLMEKRVKNDYIVPFDTRNYSWPVVAGNPQWLLGATEIALVKGNEKLTRKLGAIARNVVAQERALSLNSETGLLGGAPRYLLNPASQFPRWMDPVDIFESISLTTNVCNYAAMNSLTNLKAIEAGELGFSGDTVRRDINNSFWIPNLGFYSGLLYGSPLCPVQLHSSDNAGQAIAILSGAASRSMASSVARRTPVTDLGVTLNSPLWNSNSANAFPATLLASLWCAAMARTNVEEAYENAIGSLLYNVSHNLLFRKKDNTNDFTRPVTSLILRGLVGASFAREGIFFAPNVPRCLPGDKQLTGLRYRDAVLDIHISGTGDIISSFTIDGIPSTPFFPADSAGNHEIDIILTGAPHSRKINETKEMAVVPSPPEVTWPAPQEAVISSTVAGASATYIVQLNGLISEEVLREHYTLYNATEPVIVQFSPYVESHLLGFSSKPYTYRPQGTSTTIDAPTMARPGTRIIKDREIAKRYVETNKWKNRALNFSFNAPDSGRYAVEVCYNNGMGIVNPQRRTALRGLYVNGARAGVFVFPQLSAAWWDKDSGKDWQTQNAWSNLLTVNLKKGENAFSLTGYQPSPVYIDPLANALLISSVRLTGLSPLTNN